MTDISSKKRRIVFILPSLTAGGAERVLITLMNGLNPEKFERVFVTLDGKGPLRGLIDPQIPFHSMGQGGKFSFALFKLFFKLRALRPDIVVSTLTHLNFGVLLFRPFFPRTRFIVREAITPSYFRGRRSWPLIRFFWRTLYPLADKVISPAQAIMDELRGAGVPADNFVLLHNPVDVDGIRSTGAVDKRGQGVSFICAGRLDPQKGFDRLIGELPQLGLQKEWRLDILGEGGQRAELERLIAASHLGERVTLAGHTRRPWPEIAAADAFLMPSRHEGLPNAVLEALACGTPVIVTRESGGIAEIAAEVALGSITMVDTMDEFIVAMGKVTPRSTSGVRPSLLPESFYRQSVISSFEDLLNNLQK